MRGNRECGDVKIGGERMIPHFLQPVEKMKHACCTKDACRFWERRYVTHGTWKCASKPTRRASYTVRHTPLVNTMWCAVRGAQCAVSGVRCTVRRVNCGSIASTSMRKYAEHEWFNISTCQSHRARLVFQNCVPILGKTLRYK